MCSGTSAKCQYPTLAPHGLFVVSDFATSRAFPINSFAAGLRVRFFKVTIPVGI